MVVIMIIPRFNLSQNNETLSIIIRAPNCSLQELDVSVEENIFIFSCHPYYLRLHLPGLIEENDNTRSSFNADTGEFSFQYEKVSGGEHFPDLEFITKFLCPKIEIEDGNRKIEILGPECENPDDVEGGDGDCNLQYGFGMQGGYNFKTLSEEFTDIFEIDPCQVKFHKRQQLRQHTESKYFDADHYLADLFDNEEIEELMGLHSPWRKLNKMNIQFTPNELDFLKDLPNTSYNLNTKQIKYCHNSLLEILFAYCYDYRTTCFEHTCESGWTITKLSASLCCFDSFLQPKEALVCAFRRSLVYPLYREFKLCQQIFEDLKMLVKLGEQFIIKCLIEIYNIFLYGDSGRYILNNLFIKDYIVYIMKWDKSLWHATIQELETIVIEKKDLGLNLLEIEKKLPLENDLCRTMTELNIDEETSTDSDDLSNDSSSTESSESSDESDSSAEE